MPFSITDQLNYGAFTIQFAHINKRPHLVIKKSNERTRPYAFSLDDAHVLTEPGQLVKAAAKASMITRLVGTEWPNVVVLDEAQEMALIASVVQTDKPIVMKLANAILDCINDLIHMPNAPPNRIEVQEDIEFKITRH